MRKLWVVYNPRSSHHAAVEAEVLAPARNVTGFLVGKYEIKQTSVEHNAEMLAAMLGDGDLVVSAGGDGTAAIAANAVMVSGKDVVFSALGYGNFNDMARMLGVRRPVEYGGEYVGGIAEIIEKFLAGDSSEDSGSGVGAGVGSGVTEIYPLEVLVDGEHWRYAPCYVTAGLLAEASEIMDGDQVRKSLNTGKRGPLYSLMVAVIWYLKNRGRRFLPASVLVNGKPVEVSTTDYLAVNGPTMARLMKGEKWYLGEEKFGSAVKRLGGFWRMVGFGLRSVLFGLRLQETKEDVLEFSEPSEVEIQAEGEYQKFAGVSRIEVRKAKRGMKVILGRKR